MLIKKRRKTTAFRHGKCQHTMITNNILMEKLTNFVRYQFKDFTLIKDLPANIGYGKQFLFLRARYFKTLDSFLVVSRNTEAQHIKKLNTLVRSIAESMWTTALSNINASQYFMDQGVMSANGWYFKPLDKVLVIDPSGFSEIGYITSLYKQEKRCEILIFDTGERLEYSFISKCPELVPGYAVRPTALAGKFADHIFLL